MRARVVELEDAEVPRVLQLLPDEIVRVCFDDDVDLVRRAQLVDERRGAVERIGAIDRGVRNQAMRISASVEMSRQCCVIDLALPVSIA